MRVGLAAQRPPNQSTHLGLGRLPGRASEISQPLWYLSNSFASVFFKSHPINNIFMEGRTTFYNLV